MLMTGTTSMCAFKVLERLVLADGWVHVTYPKIDDPLLCEQRGLWGVMYGFSKPTPNSCTKNITSCTFGGYT